MDIGLWNEVWTQVGQEIAQKMTTKNWCKASGASAEMSKVMLVVTNVVYALPQPLQTI